MRVCRCEHPQTHANPRFRICANCRRVLDDRWLSTDKNFNEFFDHLAQSPDVPKQFVEHCRYRERAGRPVFGNRFHGKNNEREASEEAADFAIYMLLGQLKRRRLGQPENRAKAMEAARHAAIAWRLALELDRED